MKYRDLVMVVVLVGLVVLWMSRPAPPEKTHAATSTPAPTQTSRAPVAQATPSPALTELKPASGMTEIGHRPKLLIEILDKPRRFEDLKFRLTLEANWELVVPLDSKNLPILNLSFQQGEQIWGFRSQESVPTKNQPLRDQRQSWEIPLKSLVAPQDIESLRTAYGKKRIEVVAFLSEGEKETNPMSRRVSMLISGHTTLEP